MSEPFIGQISVVSFNFPPKGWALCNGQLLAINLNQALFSLLGTTYGGDGRTNFGLPNLQGCVPMHLSGAFPQGLSGGEETHALSYAEMPVHQHLYGSGNQANSTSAPGNVFAALPRRGVSRYSTSAPTTQINDGALAAAGGSQAHPNMQPYLTLNFVIALVGIFPSRS